MAKMVWKDEYSVGNKMLDTQHRQLIDLVNRLDGNEALDRVLEDLAHYADAHFRDEESLLEAANYPDLDQHRTQHRAFSAWLNWILEQHRSKVDSIAIRGDLQTYLRVWIANHLLVFDMAFKRWLG